MEPLALVPLGTLTITMGKTTVMQGTPAGTRVVVDYPEVTIEGERLRAKLVKVAAADWLVVGPGAVATLDMRFLLETHDGAHVYVHGKGRADATTFNQGGAAYFTPIFETDDARYAWLNEIQAVARGSAKGSVVTFELCELR